VPQLITDSAGDLEARCIVRLKELIEAYRLIRAILDNLPAGELTVRMPRKIKAGETVSRVEAPRGELFYFIRSNGTDMPERVKIRTPTLCNMPSVLATSIGHQLADVPMILAGIDPCFSCNDRAVVLRQHGQDNPALLNWDDLRQLGQARRSR
jgi:NADH-quinone oxidoreductase subunit D